VKICSKRRIFTVDVIKEKIELVLKAEGNGKEIIDSGKKKADKILLKARDKIREIEENLIRKADETIAQAKTVMIRETSNIIQEIDKQTNDEILSIREKGSKNISSGVSYIINRILE